MPASIKAFSPTHELSEAWEHAAAQDHANTCSDLPREQTLGLFPHSSPRGRVEAVGEQQQEQSTGTEYSIVYTEMAIWGVCTSTDTLGRRLLHCQRDHEWSSSSSFRKNRKLLGVIETAGRS